MNKEELSKRLEDLGRKLRELAVEYNQDYLTIACVENNVVGCNGTGNLKNHISIFVPKEESVKK